MNNQLLALACKAQALLDATRAADWLAPLALRLYLTPVFWVAGVNKYQGFEGTVQWFEHQLSLPLPALMAFLATATEIVGAVMLFLGLGVRWVSVPLMFVMLVAIFTVHIGNGWQAVADPHSPFAGGDIEGAMARLERGREILGEHGHYDWLTEHGSFVISNNGVEWGVTYFVMLLALFFIGAGRISLDRLITARLGR